MSCEAMGSDAKGSYTKAVTRCEGQLYEGSDAKRSEGQ